MIRAMAAPYQNLKFMPTGGINTGNLKDYLSCNKILCCGGSWMVKENMIRNGEFDKIQVMVKEAKELADNIRSNQENGQLYIDAELKNRGKFPGFLQILDLC